MQRWHSEVALMERRRKFELNKHRNRITGETDACHCLAGLGTMRKHRPNESCGDHCSLCDLRRLGKRLALRKFRRAMREAVDLTGLDRRDYGLWW